MFEKIVRHGWLVVGGIAKAPSTTNTKDAAEIIEKGADAISKATPNGSVVLVSIAALALAAFAIWAIVKVALKMK